MKRIVGGLLAAGIMGLLLTQAAQAGDVKGQVIFSGAVPKRPVINLTTDKAFCEKCEKGGQVLSEEWVIDPKTKGLQNVVVFLTDAKDPLKTFGDLKALQAKPAVLDQPCCTFIPRLVVLVDGQTLEAKNSSEVAHNTNISSQGGNPNLNPSLPPGKSITVPGWKAVGRPSTVACNIHPWMKAYIWTVPSPYFAVSDKDGNFVIKDVPPGEYKIVYWHESTGWLGIGKTKAGDPLKVDAGGASVGTIKAEAPKDD
jgi:hypothetical protein